MNDNRPTQGKIVSISNQERKVVKISPTTKGTVWEWMVFAAIILATVCALYTMFGG